MTTVRQVADFLEEKAPLALKMDFDNVGLLCGFPDAPVHKVLCALDITLDVIEEAKEMGAEVIVSHHPLIFTPMKQILSTQPEGKRVISLLQNGISAICMHTNLDIVTGGVNSVLAEKLGGREVEMLSECGCICELPEAVSSEFFLEICEEKLNVHDIRYSGSGHSVRRIGVCGGAGGDIIEECSAKGCDTVVTGEIHHHQWILGKELGMNLIDAGHFATENVIVPVLCSWIAERFPALDVVTSERQHGFHQGI